MVAVCKAVSPPAANNTAATTPSVTAQKIRCQTGEFRSPLDVIISITNDPESEEVTKKVTISTVAIKEVIIDHGSCSNSTNIAVGKSF